MTTDLTAVTLNCSLKPTPKTSNTEALISLVGELFEDHGVDHASIRIADYSIPLGITDDAGEGDDWPMILERIIDADILIVATPIWMGVRGSLSQAVLERMNGSLRPDEKTGQSVFYNKVAGVVVTGNEDGAHNASAHTLFNMTHMGFAVPPNADCYWVGEAGLGPSFIEAGGKASPYVQKCARYLVENCVHLAKVIRERRFETNLNTLDEVADRAAEHAWQEA